MKRLSLIPIKPLFFVFLQHQLWGLLLKLKLFVELKSILRFFHSKWFPFFARTVKWAKKRFEVSWSLILCVGAILAYCKSFKLSLISRIKGDSTIDWVIQLLFGFNLRKDNSRLADGFDARASLDVWVKQKTVFDIHDAILFMNCCVVFVIKERKSIHMSNLCYQTAHFFLGFIRLPSEQFHASENSFMLLKAPITLNLSREWLSLSTLFFILGGRSTL